MEPRNDDEPGHLNEPSKVRYVLPGQATGWAAMADKMRTYDEDKVKDVKEDIDTLLVFAGLFSAVLTAFVVESYKKLSPDTSSQMFSVMQQMSTQMASFNTPFGMINSTYQPLLPVPAIGEQPFQPSASDIRVNVLWFASLIFSLVTASFGMLIKQWLREYLAVTNPSPQARLRIRHFRYPELQRWKILEIAAVLPLLQQLSLALFFIGLCYFTESVHESIGRTSLPLVAGWAFCFTTVTILPLFFPRCPYKTTLLKRLLISTHLWLARLLSQLSLWLYLNYTGRLEAAANSLSTRLRVHIKQSDEQTNIADEDADLAVLAEVDAMQSNDELLGTVIFDSLQQIHNLSYNDVVEFILRVLNHRLSSNDLASNAPGTVNLRGLSQIGYNAIFDILIYFMKARDLDALLEDQACVRALRILFSPSRFPLPPSGMMLLKPIFQDAHTRRKLAEKLVQSCPTQCKIGDSEYSANYIRLLNSIPQMLNHLNVELEVVLDLFEGALDAWFRRVPDCSLPKFTITGNLNVWSWNTMSQWQIMQILIRIVDDALHRTNAQLQAPPKPTAMGYTRSQASSDRLSAGRLSDALVGVHNLLVAAGPPVFGLETLRHIVLNCLVTEERTLALLDAVRQIETPVFIRSFQTYARQTFTVDYPVSSKGIENLIEGLNQLRVISQTNGTNPAGPDYALRLLCLGTNLVSPSTARQYTSQWRTLFQILIDLTYQSLSLAALCPSASAHHDEREFNIDAVAYYTAKLAKSPNTSMAQCSSAAAQCLTYMQRSDRPWRSRWDPFSEEEQSKWWSAFKTADYAYPDELVEMLGAVYFASGGVDVDDSEWWRVKKLGVKERVRAALAAHADDHIVPPGPSAPGTLLTITGHDSGAQCYDVTPAADPNLAGTAHTSPPTVYHANRENCEPDSGYQ